MNTNTNTNTNMDHTAKLKTANSLVLAYFQTTAPSTSTLNRSASARVASAAGAAKQVARLYNRILESRGTAIGQAVSLQQQVGKSIRRLGLPCAAGGVYLRVRDVAAAQDLFDDGMIRLDEIKAEIVASYGVIVARGRANLGSFASEIRLPSASEVAARFTMSFMVTNQPVAIHEGVLGGLTEEVANRVRADSQRQVAEMLRQAHAGPLEDLRQQLVEFADKLRNAERLHLSQFDKLRAEAKRAKDLNVLRLPELDEVIEVAARIAGRRDTVEHTEGTRADTAKLAESAIDRADEALSALGF